MYNGANTNILISLTRCHIFYNKASKIDLQFGSPDPETERPPLLNSPEVQLRFLNPVDLCEVKRLCQEWFPIEYPDSW